MRSTTRAFLLLLFAALWAHTARASQPEMTRPAFPRGKLQAALDESIRTKRILVVFLDRDGEPWRLTRENTLTNRTLQAWMLWHGVGITLDASEDPAGHAVVMQIMDRLRRELNCTVSPNSFPTFVFFRDGKFVRLYPDPNFQGFLIEGGLFGPPDASVFYPKATQILFTADFLMDKLASTEAAWSALHRQLNPEPQPPPKGLPLCFLDDGITPQVFDPDEGADLLAILDRARDAMATGSLHQATGYYSWLWERSAEVDPAFRGLRRSFLAPEIADLCRRNPDAARRFEAHRKRLGDDFLWWEFIHWVDWMALNEILNVEGENLKLLATPLLDEQEATMLPRADYAAFQSMLGLGDFTHPEAVTPARLEFFRNLAQRTSAAPPPGTPADEWRAMLTFRRQIVTDEGSRIHAALLRRGRTSEAEEVARLVIAHADHPGASRLALVITALAAGVEPSPRFEQWVLEAAEHGESRPWLLTRLKRAGDVPAAVRKP